LLVDEGIRVGFATSTHAEEGCHLVHGRIQSTFTSTNCTSPVGQCTEGMITGAGPRRGTLVTHDLGVLDVATASFTEMERPASGTGIFANQSSVFFISGAIVNNGTGFDGELYGELCTGSDWWASALGAFLQIHRVLEQRTVKFILWFLRSGSDLDAIALRILPGATAEILLAAAAQGTFDSHRIVHDM
jgi:hypothetical protein